VDIAVLDERLAQVPADFAERADQARGWLAARESAG
jgi:hypothetical protein